MNFRDYLQALKEQGQLTEITAPVSCDLEVAAIARQEFKKTDGGKALLFQKLPDSDYSLAVNVFGNERRMLGILQDDSFPAFTQKLKNILQLKNQGYPFGNSLENASFLQHKASFDLSRIPALRSWAGEKEPYLTLAVAVSRNLDNGVVNLGLYRAQIKSAKEIALNCSAGSGLGRHLELAKKKNEKLPVALLLGLPPVYWWLAAAPLPEEVNELSFAHKLFTDGARFYATKEHHFPIPDDVEMVIEGELSITETCVEGPFGNHTGQYVMRRDCPLMRVQSVQHKDDAIIPATVVGPPPSENVYFGKANECLIRELIKSEFQEIHDISMPLSTIFHGAAILQVSSLSQRSRRELIEALWQVSPLNRSRFILLVDRDIDLLSFEQCWWRAINGLKSERVYMNGGRIAIDATGLDPAKKVAEDPEILKLLAARATEYKL